MSINNKLIFRFEEEAKTINTIAPGPTQTGWIDKELEKSILSSIPLGRLGQPQDIVNTILFLASDKASWITGQVSYSYSRIHINLKMR